MSDAARELERVRWHCRRGMLELDLVLNAFNDQRLAALTSDELDAFRRILERPDPELLDLVMGHCDPEDTAERELMGFIRAANTASHKQLRSA